MNFINHPPQKNRWVKIIIVIACIVIAIKFDPNNLGSITDMARKALPIAIEVIERLEAAEDDNVNSAEVAEDNREPQGLVLIPRNERQGKLGSRQLNIIVWEKTTGNPVGDVCAIIEQNDFQFFDITDWTTGTAELDFTKIGNNTKLLLSLDPVNHTGATDSDQNAFEFTVTSDMTVETACFEKLTLSERQQLGFDYRQVDCDSRPGTATEAYPAPLEDERSELLKPELDKPVVSSTPLTFTDGFDYNANNWPVGGNETVSGSVNGDVRIDNGALIFNSTFKENNKTYRTTIPIDRPLENFAFSAEIKSMVQPQNREDFGRFNFQFRVQEDGRYYNLGINQNGHVTLYYFYRDPDGLLKHQLIESWPGSEYGFNPELQAVNSMVVRANESLFSVKFNDGTPFVIEDLMNFIYEPGEMSLGIDGTAGNVISYRMDNLLIQEWPGD